MFELGVHGELDGNHLNTAMRQGAGLEWFEKCVKGGGEAREKGLHHGP